MFIRGNALASKYNHFIFMRSRWSYCLALLAFSCAIALIRVHSARADSPPQSADKKLSVYAPQLFFSLPVTEHENKEYVQLFALMEPLAKTSLRIEGHTFRLRVNDVDGEFKDGKASVKIGKTKFDMDSPLAVESGQAAVPLSSVPRILAEYLKRPVDFHESARRLFLDNSALAFSAELKKPDTASTSASSSALVLTFPSSVNPTISTESNKVRLVFNREPVAATGTNPAAAASTTAATPAPAPVPATYNDKLITGSSFREENGAAELTVTGSAPLMANFSDGGKTITIAAAPGLAAQNSGGAAQNAPAPATPKPPASLLPPPPRFFVMIDPGHGGDDPGAKFSDTLLEKDITLAFARRLRTELQGRGIPAVLTRDSDTALTFDQRALNTNSQRASIYIAIHAGSPGPGMRVMSAMLPLAPVTAAPEAASFNENAKPASPFLPWESAQSAYLEKSRALAAAIAQEFADRNSHAALSSSPLRPLNSIACTAIGLEISSRDPQTLISQKLQQSLAASLAAGIVNARAKSDSHVDREQTP